MKKVSSFNITWILIGSATVGTALSIALTKDTKWMQWHLSRLGEGASLSSAIFNFTIIMAGLVLLLMAMRITDEITHHKPHPGVGQLRMLLIIAAMCWAGVGAFPFDTWPVIHNVFGYGQFLVLSAAMVGLKHICPRFSPRTYNIGLMAVIITAILVALFHLTHFTTLLVVELIGQLFIYAWLLSMTYDARR
ncbi:MAG: DUF998 domain-containing protein [Candidatus Saccharimonas sp.]